MKAKINKKTLVQTLSHLHSVVEKRNTIPILANVLIDASKGKINLRNSKYQRDDSPIDENIGLRNLNQYSKSYINHLINSNEILASMILTLHNINFYQELMNAIRENIKKGTYNDFHDKFINKL